ncbi:hypothetical protein [Aurantibacillus circumpalustris]|uniref:hypothetical protein n=1 Tax=Aurantibacillus circumpalustris TaxID=3036359 RepID=UPI00295B9302|nr:hypothetical protein [Aurantibacillus circumpalustris]
MSRFKTLTFWIFVFAALGIGVYAYFHLKNNKKPELEAITLLPDHCLFYLNTTDFTELNKKINSQSLIADKLKLFKEVNDFCNLINTFDSLSNSNEELQEQLKGNTIHFAAYQEKNAWLAVLNIQQLGEQESVSKYLLEIFHATKNKENTYSFKINSVPMYFSLNEGVVAFSNRTELILESLNKTSTKLVNNPNFVQFKNTLAENSNLAIYVNHEPYSKSTAASKLNLTSTFKKGYSAGAIEIKPSQIKINGYVNPEEDEMISLFADQKPQPSRELLSNLPQNTSYFKAFGFSSYPELRIGFPLTRVHIRYWMRANENGLYNVEDEFYANTINHLVEFETQVPNSKFICFEVNDTLKASENLKYMSDSILRKDSLLIYRINDSLEKTLQLFIPLSYNSTNYAVVFRSHIYFADKSDELLSLINDLRNNRFAILNSSFASYSNQNFPDYFNYLSYSSPNQNQKDIPSFFNFNLSNQEDPFANFRHSSFSVGKHNNMFKFRFHLMYEVENLNKEQNVLWTLNLDNACSMQSSGFVNHITGENEIVVQDDNNVLYLINAKGNILWKKKLNEKIISQIHTIDAYKNNKYQLLFNTKSQIHLIDRNGNYVEAYPVKLAAETVSELSLFDYVGDKDYRVFIPCKNKRIYNYSINGSLQDKFATVETDAEVNLPIQYVKVGTSDYLVALDVEGKIYTFSRRGAGRIGLRNRANVNTSAFYVDANNSLSSTRLIYVDDKNGLINKISFDDKKEIVKLNVDLENAGISYALVDDNNSMDLIVTKNNMFRAYNFTGNLILEKTNDLSLMKTNYYGDESHSVFYSLSQDKKEIVVFDQIKSRSKTYKATNLPLVSNLFKDNKKYLIITNGAQLTCVPLN